MATAVGSADTALKVVKATWGTLEEREAKDVTSVVQGILDRTAAELQRRVLFISQNEDKNKLFGVPVPKGDKKKRALTIRYAIGSAPEQTAAFLGTQEVVLGDKDFYYLTRSDVHGHIDDVVADALLRRYRPILHLHSSEASYPAHVEWYLERVSLWFNAGDDVDLQCVKEDIASPADLIDTWTPKEGPLAGIVFDTRESRRFFLRHKAEFDPDMHGGEKPRSRRQNELANCPLYATCNVTKDGDICLTYFFFYAFNGAIACAACGCAQSTLPCCACCAHGGTHEGDWEYCAMLVSPDGGTLRAVHMSRHAGAEGQWYLAKSASGNARKDDGWHLKRDSEGNERVAIYCGYESHANYNTPGSHRRVCAVLCCIDDRTDDDGEVWDAKEVVNLGSIGRPRTPWTQFSGLWGRPEEKKSFGLSNGPTGPVLKSVFFGDTYEMNAKNCIPAKAARGPAAAAVGSFWEHWTGEQRRQNAAIVAKGTSYVTRPKVTKVVFAGDSRTDKRTLAAWLLGSNHKAARSEGAHKGHRHAATEARDGEAGGGADGKQKGRDEGKARGRHAKGGAGDAKAAKEKERVVAAAEEREPIQAAAAGKPADEAALTVGDGPLLLGVDLPDWVSPPRRTRPSALTLQLWDAKGDEAAVASASLVVLVVKATLPIADRDIQRSLRKLREASADAPIVVVALRTYELSERKAAAMREGILAAVKAEEVVLSKTASDVRPEQLVCAVNCAVDDQRVVLRELIARLVKTEQFRK